MQVTAPTDKRSSSVTRSSSKRKHASDESERKHRKHKREGALRWKEKTDLEESSKADSQRLERVTGPQRPLPPITPPQTYEPPATRENAGEEVGNDDGGLDIASKFGAAAAEEVRRNPNPIPLPDGSAGPAVEQMKEKKKEKKDRDKLPKATKTNEPMIEVTVNDRLGSKSRVPCFGSDKIGDFKKLVAMQIGRKPHEIMLKRQSERPFKDFLTLEDYGISNGVQLDLELDTGD